VLAVAAAGCGATGGGEEDLVAGKESFAENCASCHVLGRAGAKGVTGPNLDEAFRQALADGMGRDGIKGAVRQQIEDPAILAKDSRAYMPPDIVTGQEARNVAAYVANAVAKGGEDTGLLAEAGKPKGGGTATAEGGTLNIPATAQLAYEAKAAKAKAGELTIESPNPSGTPHNIALEGAGIDEKGKVVTDGGVSTVKATVKKGEYTFYCSVPGHREGGMLGKLTVE
jgi:plastocyanin